MIRRLLALALVLLVEWSLVIEPTRAAINAPVAAGQLPAFAGGACTTTAGGVAISCAPLLAQANTWGGAQTFGVGISGAGANLFSVPGTNTFSAEGAGIEMRYGGNSELTARPGGANQFDMIRGMVTNGNGNPTTGAAGASGTQNADGQVSGLAGTVRGLVNNQVGGGNNGYSVGVFGNATAEVNGAVSWGSNFTVADIGPDRSSTAVGNIASRTIEGSEIDVNVFSPSTVATGANLVLNTIGLTSVSPTFAFNAAKNTNSQPWAQGFSTGIGAASSAFVSGPASASAANVNGQPTVFQFFDANSNEQSMSLQALAGSTNGNVLALAGTTAGFKTPNLFLPSGGQIQFNGKSTLNADASNNLYFGGGAPNVFLSTSLAPQSGVTAQLGSSSLPFSNVYSQSITALGTVTSAGNPVLPHVANNTAVAALSPSTYTRFVRDGSATNGDGGRAEYTTTSTTCSLNSGAGDGGSQIGLKSGGASYTGCALIDWASVDNIAQPGLFVGNFGSNSAAADSAAVRAAVALGKTTYISTSWTWDGVAIPVATAGQRIYGAGRFRTQVKIPASLASGALFAASITSGSTTMTTVSTPPSSVVAGTALRIVGVNGALPANETVSSISGSTITLSSAATATLSPVQITSGADAVPGVFQFTSVEPGPIIEDIGAVFAQPDSTTLNAYPPMIYAQNITRWTLNRDGCYMATVCVDGRGNIGGSRITDLQESPFSVGEWIDGSLDSIRIEGTHAWPFSGSLGAASGTPNILTTNQQNVFTNPSYAGGYPVGTLIGRCDDCKVSGGLYLIGMGLETITGVYAGNPSGSTAGTAGFGEIFANDFDTFGGVVQGAGDWEYSTNHHTVGATSTPTFIMTGGNAEVVASRFFLGSSSDGQPLLIQTGGSLALSTSQFNLVNFDHQAIVQQGGILTETASNFIRTSNGTYNTPEIEIDGGQASLTNNQCTTFNGSGSTSNRFIAIATDAYHTVTGNTCPGYKYTVGGNAMGNSLTPTSAGGAYYGNR